MSLASGMTLGSYEILAPIGEGGMGEVYRARDAKLNRDVAITILPETLAADPVALARFEREAQGDVREPASVLGDDLKPEWQLESAPHCHPHDLRPRRSERHASRACCSVSLRGTRWSSARAR